MIWNSDQDYPKSNLKSDQDHDLKIAMKFVTSRISSENVNTKVSFYEIQVRT